jgi:hypothetical protein
MTTMRDIHRGQETHSEHQPRKAQWSLYVPPNVNIKILFNFSHTVYVTQLVWFFTINSDYSLWLNSAAEIRCLLWGTNWVLTYMKTGANIWVRVLEHRTCWLGTTSCKPSNFRKRVRKVINKAKLRGDQRSEVKRSKLWLNEGKDSW